MRKYSYDSSGNVATQTLANVLPPQITGQPVQRIVEPGQAATFSVVVRDASGVTYQWQFNGADIPGATGDSLLLANVGAANEGPYSVVVTNSAGTVTSVPAALMLRRDPIVNTSMPPRLIVYSDEGGSVTVTPMKPSYNLGETVTLTATPFTDSAFAGWVGDLNTIDNPAALTMNGNKTVRASFASALPRLIAYGDAGGSVTVTPMKLSYNLGETVTLTATPFAPSVFSSWMGDLNGSSNPATLTMDRNKTVRARFVSAVPLPPGCVAFWRGETDATDLIGGHDGTFFAGATIIAPRVTASGKVGGAFDFDGTVHVRVPDSAALKLARLTVEAWVFPTAAIGGSNNTIIARGSSTNDITWDLGLLGPYFLPEFASHGNHFQRGPFAIPLNEWTHLAITFDGLIKRLYVNGAQVDAQDELGALVYDAAPVPVTIGSNWALNGPETLFNGRIDEVALYNRALTADEVRSIYNADFAGKNISQLYFTSPSQFPDAALGVGYTQQVTAILGTAPISFSVSPGTLPPGITLSSAGVVSGVPGVPGIFDFTVRATDVVGSFSEQLCVLRVL